jgi:hypothetical protein
VAPAGAVTFFNRSTCPSGWTELTTARGRYLVGRPSGGTLGGSAGTALGNLENRAVGRHSHGVTDPGHSHTISIPRGLSDTGSAATFDTDAIFVGSLSYLTSDDPTGITINNAGSDAGTNAPYLQLLVCQKS